MTRIEEFTHLNKLALRLIRFKFNRFINTYIMKTTKAERIAQQVWGAEGVGKYDRLNEIMAREGLSIGEARRSLQKSDREKAKAKRLTTEVQSKVEQLKAKKGW